MILIQAVLIIALILISFNFMSSRGSSRTNAYKKLALLLFVVAAFIAVLFPDLTNTFAHLLGVGRGADLMLYGLTVVVIFQLLNTYVKDKQGERRFVQLARKVALLETQVNDTERKS